MSTLQKMTEDWRVAVGSDSGLGDKKIKYDLRGDGFILIGRDSVTNEDGPADLTFSAKIDVIDGILSGRVNPNKALLRGKLKISPMSAALKLQPQIEALLDRLPKDGSGGVIAETEPEPDFDPALPPRSPEMTLFTPDMFDHLTPQSFVAHPAFPGLLLRDIKTSERMTAGRVLARVLKADPAATFDPAGYRFEVAGPKISVLVSGSARFDIEGLGEVEFTPQDSWTVPAGNQQRLAGISPDFELLELEFPNMTSVTAGTAARADMVARYGSDSYRPVAGFDGAVERHLGSLRTETDGGAHAIMLRGNPPHVWDGSPWHMHHQEIQVAYMTKGTADFEFEGVGIVHTEAGAFWFQQPRGRHRERAVSLDFEAINIDIPAASPTTVFFYDADAGEYVGTTLESVYDIADKMEHAT